MTKASRSQPIIVRRMAARGDVLLTTPVVRALHERFPRAEILIETLYPEIFWRNPDVTVAAKSFAHHHGSSRLIDLDMSYENQPLTHIVQAYFNSVGFPAENWNTEIFPGEQDRKWAARFFRGDRVCAMHVGPSTWPGKTWPIERYRRVARELRRQGWKVALVGAPRENVPHDVDLRGRTTIHRLAAFLSRARLFIGEDSFPMNCAVAVGCPTIGLFGCTSSRFVLTGDTPSIGVDADPAIPCAGSRHRARGHISAQCSPACIESIGVERVLQAVAELAGQG